MAITVSLPSTMSPIGQAVSTPGALATPTILLAPLIDPYTHDLLSLTDGMDPIDAQVINALKIVRGSGPAVSDVGARFGDIRKITAATPNDIKAQVQTALSGLVRRGDIRYAGTIIDYNEPGKQMVQARIQWINLRAFDGSVRNTSIQLGEG
ncbi:MAG: hypothetical protein GY854_02200 [Deltaproteobacteria bacterium]|nr:hypothetical protein [Deltaproteobacteria bacterium]